MDKNLLQKAQAPMIALINPQAPKGRPDINHGCNPWAEATPANHRCNPCAVTHRAKTMLLLLLLAMTTAAQAQSTFGGGSGTETNPYIISTTDHLDQLAADVNSGMEYQNVYFKLMADLDYTGKTYTPIGNSYMEGGAENYHKFKGIFNGNNHSINNVTINSEDSNCGLFGHVGYGGTIYALTLGGNSSIVSTGDAGGIAGEVWSDAKIINCHVGENVLISVHPVASGSAYAPGGLGGIAGCSYGKINSCISKATINNGDIVKTENLGGVVGELGSAGRVEYCRFLGTVSGTRHVGDVVGYSNGTITYNYYHTTVRHGGVDGNDTDGAKWMGTVSFGEHISGSIPSATFWDGGTPYFGAGMAMVMSNLNYDAPAGYVVASATYSANGVALVKDGAYHCFTMPSEDVTITGSATLKRDIGYGGWVTIDIPSQACTGDPLTPVVTVTDNMTGTPVTLVENTDYTVTLPDGGCVNWGQHTITITGIGDFGGQTTAVFTVTYPGGGSGTETDPFIIVTTDEMDALAAAVNGGDVMNGKHFRLLADLNYSGKTYTPIGTMSSRFQGTFDGQGHSINNVVINQPDQDYQGLFALIYGNGTVKNLVLGEGSTITGGYYVGGIAGLCSGTITGCTVSEGVSISGNQEVGGIAGRIVGTLSKCVNKASVSGTNRVGGIAGMSFYQPFTDNLNLGAVSGNFFKGGIVGFSNNNDVCSNNYYAGTCNVGGINGSDVAGKAMRGYTIEVKHPLIVSLEGSIGVFYDGKVYAGENQEAIVGFEVTGSSIVPQCLNLSAGTLTDNGDGTHTITMPAEDITVSGNIVKSYMMYYEIPCEGGTTATVVFDTSYATMYYANVPYSITYGENTYYVTGIGDNAFEGCTALEYVSLHEEITTIGSEAFKNCSSIVQITTQAATPPVAGQDAFLGVPENASVAGMPFCYQYDYSVAPEWNRFSNFRGSGPCENDFMGIDGTSWSNPQNWSAGVVPDGNSRVGVRGTCEIDDDVTVGSITLDCYINEEYGLYDRLIVKSGKTLTANNFIWTTGDATHFIIEDGAQVVHPNTDAQATVEKNIAAHTATGGWHFIASPLVGSITPTADNGFLANEYDLYFYDEPTHYWRNHKQGSNNANPNFDIEPLKGYLYANSANDTLQLQGTLRTATETVNFPLSHASADGILIGFNLVGNPFAHNVTSFTGSNVATEVYQLNDLRNEVIAGSISTDNPLKPGEGFFVKAMAEDASITFNDNGGAKGGAKALESVERPTIALEISQNNLLIDRLILKTEGAPLEKFTLNENGTKIYATEGAQDWAVVVIASEAKQSSPTEQPINFKAAKNGTYTLTVNVENMDLDYLHLIDNLTGADVDLLAIESVETPTSGNGPSTSSGTVASYTFTAKTTDYESRFKLVFSADEDVCEPNAPFAYISNGNIIINGTGTLQIIDILGKELVRKELSTFNSQLSTLNFVPGVYVLRLIDGDSIRTQKMIVE